MAGDHAGRRAVVTGGANGIGAATAGRLRAGGARVVVLDREPGDGADTVRVDLADAGAVVAAAEQALHRLGGVDVLVNCAGVSRPQPLPSLDVEVWAATLAVNLTAPVLLMRELGGAMAAAGSGRIVNVTSVHARFGEVTSLAYDASKGGLEAATRTAALELADAGVLVNAVAPGYVRTRMSVVDGVDELEGEGFRTAYVGAGRLPLRRAAEPPDVAEVVAWLASGLHTHVTGQVLTVDGGLTAPL